MMKRIIAALAAVALILATAAPAVAAFKGKGKAYDEWLDGRELVLLENLPTGEILVLRGTEKTCGRPGASYAHMRAVLESAGPGQEVHWWVDKTCNAAAPDMVHMLRVCIQTEAGRKACTSYEDEGRLDHPWSFD